VQAWTSSQPRTDELQIAKECPEDDRLVIFDAALSAAVWTRGSGGEERCDLPRNNPPQFQQERLGLSKTQTDVFQSLMLLVQHDDVLDALFIVIGHYHQLQLEAHEHSHSV
jgi:hypothetical protein